MVQHEAKSVRDVYSTSVSLFPFVPLYETIEPDNYEEDEQHLMTEPFGQALKQIRQRAGISVTELCEETSMARSHYYRLENGEVPEPNIRTLNSLAEALGIEPEELYDIAWQTTGTGPGLPSIPTYFISKYEFDDKQIAIMMRAFKRAQNLPPGGVATRKET